MVVNAIPAHATLRIGGKAYAVGAPIQLRAGQHTAVLEAPGYKPLQQLITLQAGKSTQVQALLQPAASGSGRIDVSCPVPGVTVTVGHSVKGNTPLQPFEADAGKAKLTFSRGGYTPVTKDITVAVGKTAAVTCDVAPMSPIPLQFAAKLLIEASESGSQITINGFPYVPGSLVPAGPHRIEVTKAGFETWQKEVVLAVGESLEVMAALSAKKVAPVSGASGGGGSNLKLMGIILTAGGAVLGGITAGLAVANNSSFDDWVTEQQRIDAGYAAAFNDASLHAAQTANDNDLRSIQSLNKVSWTLGIVGAAAVVTGVTLLVVDITGAKAEVSTTGTEMSMRVRW